MASSIPTKPLPMSSTPCLTSMRSGSISARTKCPGGLRFPPGISCCLPPYGGKTTTASRTRIPALSTWSRIRVLMSCGSTSHPMLTAYCRWWITASAAPTTPTSSWQTSKSTCSTSAWKRPSSTAPRVSASGIGLATMIVAPNRMSRMW